MCDRCAWLPKLSRITSVLYIFTGCIRVYVHDFAVSKFTQICLALGQKLALCQYVAAAEGEGRLVGCCPRLRGPDLCEDNSPNLSLPFKRGRNQKSRHAEKHTEGQITTYFYRYFPALYSQPPSSSHLFALVQCLLGHSFILLYHQTPTVSEFIQTGRHKYISISSEE